MFDGEPLDAVIRGEKVRKVYAGILRRHRAAISIQKNARARILRKKFNRVREAATSMQSGNHHLRNPSNDNKFSQLVLANSELYT